MREIVDRCNVCLAQRGQGNHWFLMELRRDRSPVFMPWDDAEAGDTDHCCSVTCAHKALDAWFGEQQAGRTASSPPPVAVIGDDDIPF